VKILTNKENSYEKDNCNYVCAGDVCDSGVHAKCLNPPPPLRS